MNVYFEAYPWVPPSGWTGPNPVVYRSFDTLDYITTMEGTEETNNPLTQGKVYFQMVYGYCFIKNDISLVKRLFQSLDQQSH